MLSLMIFNNESETVNVSFTTNLNILFSPSVFSLPSFTTTNVTVYIFEVTEQVGYILINYELGVFNIPVYISVDTSQDNTTDTGDTVSTNFSLFPTSPKSGSMFVIYSNMPVNTSGFLWLKEQIYPVDIRNGFCTVVVDENVYGTAHLWLYGEGFISDFEIACGIEGEPSFNLPDSPIIGDVGNIRLTVGGKPISGIVINVKDPDDNEFQQTTDNDGEIFLELDLVGDWMVGCLVDEKNIVKKFSVDYKPLGLISDKQQYESGETVIITMDEINTNLVIKRNKIIILDTVVGSKQYEFIPDKSGDYTVEAKTTDRKGSTSFSVTMPTNIKILDGNNMETTILRQGDNYIVKIIDENNQLIDEYDKLFTPGGVISLNNGLGFWTPNTGGQVTLTVKDQNGYVGSNLIVSIESIDTSDIGPAIAGVVVVFLVFLFLYFLYKKGRLKIPKLKPRSKKTLDFEQIL